MPQKVDSGEIMLPPEMKGLVYCTLMSIALIGLCDLTEDLAAKYAGAIDVSADLNTLLDKIYTECSIPNGNKHKLDVDQPLYVAPTFVNDNMRTTSGPGTTFVQSPETFNKSKFLNISDDMKMIAMAKDMWAGRIIRSIGDNIQSNQLVNSRLNPFLKYLPGYPAGWHDNIDIEFIDTFSEDKLMFSKYLYSPTKK